jgi:hypothetical protein
MGLEGMIAKDGASAYQQGRRSDYWLKIKAFLRQEAVIAGFTRPRRTVSTSVPWSSAFTTARNSCISARSTAA